MPAPFVSHRDVAESIGAWPFAPTPDLANPQQIPGSITPAATVLGFRRDPPAGAGYVVGGLSFYVYIDGVQTQVIFPGGNQTLAQVIAQINSDVGLTVAFNANGFLRITSNTTGATSSVKVESIPSSEAVFTELGLIDGYEAFGGDIEQAQNIDPSRQVSWTGQLSAPVGEQFSANAMNRMAFRLGLNADRLRGFTDLKRVAVRASESFVGSGLAGVQIGTPSDKVYLGPNAGPTIDQLKGTVVVLDDRGNEFTKEMRHLVASFGTALNFSYDADSGEQRVSSLAVFAATDVTENMYIIADNLTVETQMNDVPMKIIRFISTTEVAVDSVDPATGVPVQISESSIDGSKSRVFNVRCEVDGFYSDPGFTTPIDPQVQVARGSGSGAVSAVIRNNRIRVGGVDFNAECQPGDLVEWTGGSSSDPWSNNGNYRIGKIVNGLELELVGEDYGPVYLNPNVGGGLGTVTVKTDGDFIQAPYVRFVPATLGNFTLGNGAIPDGENFQVVYYKSDSLRNALEVDPAAFSDNIREQLSAVAETQNAIMRLVGPSVTEFDEVLYGENMLNMDFLSREHHNQSGRHSTIRPDIIDQFPGSLTGPTVTFRSDTAVDGPGDAKVRLVEAVTGNTMWAVDEQGKVLIGNNGVFDLHDALDRTGSPLRAHFAVDGFTNSLGLIQGLQAMLALSGTDTHNFGDKEGTTNLRFFFDDGVIAQPRIFNIAQKNYSLGSEPGVLAMNVLNDGAGNQALGCLVVGEDGNIGITMGSAASPEPVPQAPLHIRSRFGSGVQEMVRIEGDGIADPTIALTYKPRTDQPFFSFIEVDHDNPGGSGDWFMNFVLTTDMDSDSDGSFGEGSFRWVVNGGFGIGTEILRVNSAGVDNRTQAIFGTDLLGSAADAILPRLAVPAGNSGDVYLFQSEATVGTHVGYSMVSQSGGHFEELWGCKKNLAGNYSFDKIGTNTHFFRRSLETNGATAATMRWQWIPDGGVVDPFTEPAFVDAMALELNAVGAVANVLVLDKAFLEITNPGTASNISKTTNPIPNTLYAKNIPKAWALIESNGGAAPTVSDGFGVDGVADTGSSIQATLDNAIVNATTEGASMVSLVSVTNGATIGILRSHFNSTTTLTITGFSESGGALDLTQVGELIEIVLLVWGKHA